MTKEQLLSELRHDTYVIIKPSPLHGIGVFALRTIPKGQRGLFSKNIGEWIPISKKEVSQLPQYSIDLVENYCLYDEENYFIPDYGFKVMDLVNFLNHSGSIVVPDNFSNLFCKNFRTLFVQMPEICEQKRLLRKETII